MRTEHQIDYGTEGQNVIRNKEIFQVHDRGAAAQRLQSGKDVEAQDAGDAEYNDHYNVEAHGFLPAESEQIHTEGDNVFKYPYDGRQSGEEQEQEEQRSPEPSARHLCKNIWKGDEYKPRSCPGFYAKGKACGEYDQPRRERHESIQKHDTQRLPGERA